MQRRRKRLLGDLAQGVGFKYLRSRQRQRADAADCFDTRQHANFFERLLVKPPPALVRGKAPGLDVDLKREKMCGIETPVKPAEFRERTDHQPGADQEHERQRHFRGHERVSQPAGTAKRLAAACFQALVDVAFRRLPGGNQPQSHARDQRQRERRREDGPVNTYGLLPRQVGRPQEKEQVNAFDGNEETGYASDQGDQKILGQKLAQAMRSTKPTAPSRARMAGLTRSTRSLWSGTTWNLTLVFP